MSIDTYTSSVGKTETAVVYTNTSRRFGSPIIVVSVAPRKICSFDCVYCYGGPTQLKTNRLKREQTYPLDFISSNLEAGFKSLSKKGLKPNAIVFCSFTDAPLHPDFPDIVDSALNLRDKYFGGVDLVIYTNGTSLARKGVKEVVKKFDRKLFKLDAADEETFRRINRPCEGICLNDIVESFQGFKGIEIQTMVVDKIGGNFESIKSDNYVRLLSKIRPNIVWFGDADTPIPSSSRREGYLTVK